MNKEQFQLWKALKTDALSSPRGIRYGDIKRSLLYSHFSDDVYAYMIQHILATGDAQLYETLLSDIEDVFKENRLRNFGNRTNQKLLVVINELIFACGTESYVASLLYIETLVRFFSYIRHSDIEFDKDMLDVLLFNIVNHAKLRTSKSLHYKRITRHFKFILLDYDYTDDSKSKVLIEHASEILYKNLMQRDTLEFIMFDDDGDYATGLTARKRIFDNIIRHTNYMKLTNQDKA